MLIAQISDLHISAPGEKAYNIADMAENLIRCIENINQLDPRPDLVIVTGDITNNARKAETDHAAKLLNNLLTPCYVIPGNHDNTSHLLSSFGDQICPTDDSGAINYVIEGHKVRLIGLDSTANKKPGGEITPAQVAWLDTQLSKAPQTPTLLFMHHPPVKCSVLETDEDGFEGTDLLAGVVEKYDNIERIVCGHIHLPVHARWHGTIVTTAPSIGMRLGLDLPMQKESEFYLNAPGYLLHHWTRQNNLITHAVSLESTSGPYPFKDQAT